MRTLSIFRTSDGQTRSCGEGGTLFDVSIAYERAEVRAAHGWRVEQGHIWDKNKMPNRARDCN